MAPLASALLQQCNSPVRSPLGKWEKEVARHDMWVAGVANVRLNGLEQYKQLGTLHEGPKGDNFHVAAKRAGAEPAAGFGSPNACPSLSSRQSLGKLVTMVSAAIGTVMKAAPPRQHCRSAWASQPPGWPAAVLHWAGGVRGCPHTRPA